MNERNKESLSALMDGEADELEVRRVLNQLENNDELMDSWKTYHLMASVMRDEQIDRIDLTRGINQALDGIVADDSETATTVKTSSATAAQVVSQETSQPSEKSIPAWYKPLTSVAIAASVTLAVLVGVQNLEPASTGVAMTAALKAPAPGGQSHSTATASGDYFDGRGAKEQQVASQVNVETLSSGTLQEQQKSLENAQQQLQEYILENSSKLDSNAKSALPFARVVDFNEEK